MDNCVERDGHRRSILNWITPADLAACLQNSEDSTRQYLVIDMRSFSLYCGKHIKSAHSLSFSPILMRRMLKGAISLDSLITDEQLLSSITNAEQIVLYDSCSTPANPKQELRRFVEMLKARHHNKEFKTLLGECKLGNLSLKGEWSKNSNNHVVIYLLFCIQSQIKTKILLGECKLAN